MIYGEGDGYYLGDPVSRTIVKLYINNYYGSNNYNIYAENNINKDLFDNGLSRVSIDILKNDPLFKLINNLNLPKELKSVELCYSDDSKMEIIDYPNRKTINFQENILLNNRCTDNVRLVLGDSYTAEQKNYKALSKLWEELPKYVNCNLNEFVAEFGSDYSVVRYNHNFEKVLTKTKKII